MPTGCASSSKYPQCAESEHSMDQVSRDDALMAQSRKKKNVFMRFLEGQQHYVIPCCLVAQKELVCWGVALGGRRWMSFCHQYVDGLSTTIG